MSSSFRSKTVRMTHHVFLVMDYRSTPGHSESIPPVSMEEMVKNAVEKSPESLSHSLDAKFHNFAKRFSEENTSVIEQAFKKAKRENFT